MSSKINKIDADLTFIHKRIDVLDQPKAQGSNPLINNSDMQQLNGTGPGEHEQTGRERP